jgi:nitrogen fixation protein FixH
VKTVLAVAAVAALGAVGATIWVGSHVREDTVVGRPYEEGLRYDADRRAREASGWKVAVEPPVEGAGPFAFHVRERGGAAVDGAAVTLTASRLDTSRGQLTAKARAAGDGRYVADVAFPAAGRWDVQFDIRRGEEGLRFTAPVDVRPAPGAAAARGCDLAGGPCTVPLAGGGELTLDLGPRPLRSMADLTVSAAVRDGGAPLEGARVEVAFDMTEMPMPPAHAALAPAGDGRYVGKAVLVRCASGHKEWRARVAVEGAGAPRKAELVFRVAE